VKQLPLKHRTTEFQNTYADKTQLYFRDSTTNWTSIGTATIWLDYGAEITTGLKATATTFYGWAIQGGNYYVYRTGATIGNLFTVIRICKSDRVRGYVNKSL
jgi:hypothetical protein